MTHVSAGRTPPRTHDGGRRATGPTAVHRRVGRRLLGVLTALAVVLSLAQVAAPAATADTAGTPPNIIDYTRVAAADWPALQRFEAKAARDTLVNHSLPESDYDAVRAWGRNQVRTQMWADLVVIMTKAAANRTSDEQAVYRWFQGLVQQQNVTAARASVDEFIRYSGLTESTYTTAEPVNYNNPVTSLATGGYCTYRAPGPYVDDYIGYLDQTCYTASTNLLNFAIPMPSYDEFIAYGQYRANQEVFGDPTFANTSFEVAASLSIGAASVAFAIGLPIGIAIGSTFVVAAGGGGAVALAVFPFAVRAGTLALVGAGAVAAVVGTAILFVVTVVLASIQLDAQMRMGERLKENLDELTATPPDLQGLLLEDEERAADTSLSEDERKPRYYPGFFTTFIAGTLPEADPEPCDSGLVIGGGIYSPGCVNEPVPAPVAVDDPVFRVTPQGSTTSRDQRTIAIRDPYNGGSALTRASGKGWYVHQAAGSSRRTQSLTMPYTDWAGKTRFAERVWDATNGYRFAVTPVGPGAEPEDATITDALEVTQTDGTKVTVRLVPSTLSAVDVTVPESVLLNQVATFSATATGSGSAGVTYAWWFPRLPTEGFAVTWPAGVPTSHYPLGGASVTRAFDTAGAVPVFLEIRSPDGTVELRSFLVNVVDGRAVDTLTVVPPEGLRVGQSTALDVTSASGAFVQLQVVGDLGPCGVPLVYPVPTLDVRGLAAGTCTIRAYTSANNPTVKPVEQVVTFPVFKGQQTITAGDLVDLEIGESQQVSATASSGLPVAVGIQPATPTVCTASGLTVTASAPGTCRVLLTQAGDANRLPAPPVEREFTVSDPVTVTARDETVVYGQAPAYAFDVTGADTEVTGVQCSAEAPLTVGTHPITCSGADAGDGIDVVYVAGTLTVTAAPVTVTVTPPSVQYSDAVPSLVGSWSANGLVDDDELVGTPTGCRADGLSVTSGSVTSPAGTYPLADCTGLSNPNYDVTYLGSLTVLAESATITTGGEWYVSSGSGATADVPLRATVTQAADGSLGDLTKARVDVLLFRADNTTTTPDRSALGLAPDAAGAVATTIAALPAGLYRVVVRFSADNGWFAGSSAMDELSVYQPVAGASVTGGGWVADAGSGNGRTHFGLSVRFNKKVQPQGQVTVSWRNPQNGYDYLVRSTSWNGGGVAIRSTTAGISAKATLTVVDPATGLTVTALSGGNHTIKVDVVDAGKGRSSDTYAMTVRTPSGSVLRSLATTPVGGGNIKVQP